MLVVDDDATTRFVMAEFVRRAGGVPVVACDGDEALQLIAREDFDVVVTDFSMPGVTGDVVARRARTRTPRAGIVILTGYADSDIEREATSCRAELLRKPVGPAGIIDAINRSLAAIEA